jgi:putative two-component system response regulator
VERAVAHIRDNAGTQFDPGCVSAFETALPALLAVMEKDRAAANNQDPVHARFHSVAATEACRSTADGTGVQNTMQVA